MKRVGLVGFIHESNSFHPVPTTLEQFRNSAFLSGNGIVRHYSHAHHEIGGMLESAAELGLEIVPLVVAEAVPSGPVAQAAYEEILQCILRSLSDIALDGILLALHGAMVAAHLEDADGSTAERIRTAVGARIPIVATLDLHANVSARLIRGVTAATVYRTYPHLDQRERGREAARMLGRILEHGIHPVQLLEKPPMVISILAQQTSVEPMSGVVSRIESLAREPGILSASFAAGFPYADVPAMGPAILLVAAGDAAGARDAARRVALEVWSLRDRFCRTGKPIAEAVREVVRSAAGTVVLLDVGDNVGGGSPGDGTLIFQALRDAGIPDILTVLYDPEAVRACLAAGVGQSIEIDVGGRTDALRGAPVRTRGRVRLVHDGLFEETKARHGGARFHNQGITAVVETVERCTVVLTSLRVAPFSLEQILSLGIKPERQRAIVVKGAIAPRAAYEPVAARFIEVDSPGITAANPLHFKYARRRRPMYPFESDTTLSSGAMESEARIS